MSHHHHRPGRRLPVGALTALLALAGAGTPLAAEPALDTRDDRFVVIKGQETILDVLANDTFDQDRLRGGRLELRLQPERGSAWVERGADDGTVADDRIGYSADALLNDPASLVYRLCEAAGTCVDGRVDLVVRPLPDQHIQTATGRGWVDLEIDGGLPWDGPRRELMLWDSQLTAPEVFEDTLAVDPTPHDPWDGAREGTVAKILTATSPQSDNWFLLADAQSLQGGDIDLYMGFDSDGDGVADEGEVRCVSAMAAASERCELETYAEPSSTYWVLAHNRSDAPQAARLEVYASPKNYFGSVPQLGIATTGPAWYNPGDDQATLRVSWRAPEMLPGSKRLAYVLVEGLHPTSGIFPVLFERDDDLQAPLALRTGVAEPLALDAGAAHEGVFIDVPPGASRLDVLVEGLDDVQVFLARTDFTSGPAIPAAPPRNSALRSMLATGNNRSLSVDGGELMPGRWYVTPVNPGQDPIEFSVQATVSGPVAPYRPGSYFNPERPGHGVFLYPAGAWYTAGLWYTYLQDGTPVWYYLQGPTPGDDGLLTLELLRTVWLGNGSVGTYVGRAIFTPDDAGRLQMTYELDGETGSETLEPLGRGCPSLGGAPLDASSHWFNPAPSSDGTGFSVQLFPNYEFYAAFIYDRWGMARFLTAEKAGFGGGDATIPVQQLSGFCPLCERSGDPQRATVGTLRRVYDRGSLSSIQLDAEFIGDVEGAWFSDDAMRLLGGPGSTQGCDP